MSFATAPSTACTTTVSTAPTGSGTSVWPLSHDGVHWTKPNLGLIPYAGNFDTNIIGLDVFGSPFIDLFDTPDRRYKVYSRVGRARGERDRITQGDSPDTSSFSWPPARGRRSQERLPVVLRATGVYWRGGTRSR